MYVNCRRDKRDPRYIPVRSVREAYISVVYTIRMINTVAIVSAGLNLCDTALGADACWTGFVWYGSRAAPGI